MSDDNQILKDNAKPLVEKLLDKLNEEGNNFFSGIPKVNLTHKGEDILICFLNEVSTSVDIQLNQKPSNVKFCAFLNKDHLLNKRYNAEEFARNQLEKIKQEVIEESAYNTNLTRVENLIEDNHFAVALVFIISAFESVLLDIFYRYNHLWFYSIIIEIEYNDLETNNEEKHFKELIKIHKKFGNQIDPATPRVYHSVRKIDGVSWGILQEPSWIFEKWKNNIIWQYIFKTAKHLKILEDYRLKILGNKSRRLGHFELLKDTLISPNHMFQGINFQSIKEKNGVIKCYKRFFGIDLQGLSTELKIIGETLQKRHKIIHGSLRDDEIEKEEVRTAKDALITIVNYVKDKIIELNAQFFRYSIFFD